MIRRTECTIDANGQVRSGPPGAWWTHLEPRPGAGGFSPELPHHRSVLWNAWVFGLVALALVLIEFIFRMPWLELATYFLGPIVAAIPVALVVGRISRRRFERLGVPLTPVKYPATPVAEPIRLAGRGLPTCHCQGHGVASLEPRESATKVLERYLVAIIREATVSRTDGADAGIAEPSGPVVKEADSPLAFR